MPRLGKFFLALGLIGMFGVTPAYAETAAAAPDKAMQELSSKLPTDVKVGQDSAYSCPVGGAPSGGSPPTDPQAYMTLLNKAQLKGSAGGVGISLKNLPSGNYRERCFGCLTMPDENGEKQLNCVCPVKNSFERVTILLSKCKEGEEITYCGGMLVCGKCMYTEDHATGDLGPKGGDIDANSIMQILGQKKGK